MYELPNSDTLKVADFFALEAWINTTEPKNEQFIIARAPTYEFGLNEGKMFLRISKTWFKSNTIISTDQWHHVAAVVKPQTKGGQVKVSFYLDGKLDGRQDCSEIIRQKDEHILIGLNDDDEACFKGLIDEVAIHSIEAEQVDISDEQFLTGLKRAYVSAGEIISKDIVLPKRATWTTFNADAETPKGTSVGFDILDAKGKVLWTNAVNGADISAIKAKTIRLRASLNTKDQLQSPLLRSWSVLSE